MELQYPISKKVFILIILFFSTHSYADTLLVGWDATDPAVYNDSCWANDSTSIHHQTWKATRVQARANGTISYFTVRTAVSNGGGCDNDSGCWAIYDSDGFENIGGLKAYGCFAAYDWTRIGAGVHKFSVTNTVTNLNITSGTHYYLVFYSYAYDRDDWGIAGCSASVRNWRGTPGGQGACEEYYDPNDTSVAVTQYDSLPPPPAESDYDYLAASWFMYGVWGSDTDNTPPAPPTGLHLLLLE